MKYIFLHEAESGKEIMINPKTIEMIKEGKMECKILFQSHSTFVKESYEEVKEAVLKWASLVDGE